MVDASAIVDYLLGQALAAVASSIEQSGTDLNVPAFCDVEVASGLRRAVRRHVIDKARARASYDAYLDLPLTRHDSRLLMRRALDLDAFSVQDAVYVVLAEYLNAPLLTTDARLARAVAGVRGLRVTLA